MNELPLVDVLHGLEHLDAEADHTVGGESVLAVGEQPLLQVAIVHPGVDQHWGGAIPSRSQERVNVTVNLDTKQKKINEQNLRYFQSYWEVS